MLNEMQSDAIMNAVEVLTPALEDLVIVSRLIPDDQLTDEAKARFVRIHAAIGIAGTVLLVINAEAHGEHDVASALMGLQAFADFHVASRVIDAEQVETEVDVDADDGSFLVFGFDADGNLNLL